MKHRFETQKSSSSSGNLMISAAVFCIVLAVFILGISRVSKQTDAQAMQTLEQALNRGIIHCYTIEGSYPENLQYLKDHYGLTYDEERFFVDYQVLGSNIIPEITIIDRRDRP